MGYCKHCKRRFMDNKIPKSYWWNVYICSDCQCPSCKEKFHRVMVGCVETSSVQDTKAHSLALRYYGHRKIDHVSGKRVWISVNMDYKRGDGRAHKVYLDKKLEEYYAKK